MSILEGIEKTSDIKKLNMNQLETLCGELRERIISVVRKNGGHLSSNLGAVELTVALYYVFDFPQDKLLFDVGHQSYAHKILSERNSRFDTIRKEGGLSGFTNIFESEYDAFCAGHAGDSISASLGYCLSRDMQNQDYFVIDIVGDGSVFNGENLEALTSDEKKPNKFLLILNDNGMSISPNNNGLYKVVSKVSSKKSYSKTMNFFSRTIGRCFIGRALKRFKRFIKFSMSNISGTIDAIGLKYIGVFDGNDIKELVGILENIKRSPRPTLLHVKTTKGKGYSPAELNADMYHGVGKDFQVGINTFSQSAGKIITEYADNNDKICVICAGMKDGTGLKDFSEKHPNRFIDVGIAEEHAVTLASGMAISGMRPVVCIYSTFLQRAYDQIMMNVCLQNLPVIFMLDRAGFVGADGITHQGLFDLSYLGSMPNMTVFEPKDSTELKDIFGYCMTMNSPVAIRYPNGINDDFETHSAIDSENLWEIVSDGENTTVLCVGARNIRIALAAKEKSGKNFRIINARCVKPLDKKLLLSLDGDIVTMEENILRGGFGSSVLEFYDSENILRRIKILGVDDKFIAHAKKDSQADSCGLSVDNLLKIIDN